MRYFIHNIFASDDNARSFNYKCVLALIFPLVFTACSEQKFNKTIAEQNNKSELSQLMLPLLREKCGACHDGSRDDASDFANANPDIANEIIRTRNLVNFAVINESTLIKRLNKNHNCWSDCGVDATQMQKSIDQWINQLSLNETETTLTFVPTGSQDDSPVQTDNITPETNTAPVANNNYYATQFNTQIILSNLLNNDIDADGDTLVVSTIDAISVQGGKILDNNDGTYSYTPPLDYAGRDAFNYIVTDTKGLIGTATIYVTVQKQEVAPTIKKINNVPSARNESYITLINTSVTTENVLANDWDIDGDTLTVSSVEAISSKGGNILNNRDGTFSYDPPTNFVGTDFFNYTITDGQGGFSSAAVLVIVEENNVIETDPSSIDSFSASVHPLLVQYCSACHDGSLAQTAFAQTDATLAHDITLQRQIADLENPTTSKLVSYLSVTQHNCWSDCSTNASAMANTIAQWQQLIAVAENAESGNTQPVNTIPVATNDRFITQSNVPLAFIDVLSNDTDSDGDTLTISFLDITSVQGGSVGFNLDNTLAYTPAINFVGQDSFQYTITDGQGGTANATVSLTVEATSPPESDSVSTDAFASSLHPILTQNCGSCHDGSLILTAFAQADVQLAHDVTVTRKIADLANSNASKLVNYLAINAHNCWSDCTTNAGVLEAAIAQWQQLITEAGSSGTENNGNANNTNPVAKNDNNSTLGNTAITINNVLNNDSDADGDTLVISDVDAVSIRGGTIINNQDGSLRYTPPINYAGTDFFYYGISDGQGGSANAVVFIVVEPNNAVDTTPPSAEAFSASVYPLLVQYCAACHDGSLTLTPFALADAQLAHDAVLEKGIADLQNPIGSKLVKYLAINAHNCWSECATNAGVMEGAIAQWQQLLTNPVNNNTVTNSDPVAINDNYVTQSNLSMTTGNVLINDFDSDGGTLAINAADTVSVQNATVINNLNGTFTYTPAIDFSGIDSFRYTIIDGQNGSSTALVYITVNINNTPVAVDDLVKANQGTLKVISTLLENDIETAAGTNTIISVDRFSSQGGTVVLNADNSISYTAPSDITGADSFTYTISNGLAIDSAWVQIDINAQPIAVSDVAFTYQNITANTKNVLLNDIDTNGDQLLITSFDLNSAQAGSISYNGNGSFTYAPPNDFLGSDSFQYIVSDGRGGAASTTVFIEVSQSSIQDSNRYLQFLNQSSPLFTEDQNTAAAYYAAIDPVGQRTTLEDWRNINGLNIGADGVAIYINNNDLGFARRMFIRTDPTTGIISSYVENYATLEDAINERNLIATVATEYTVEPGADPLDPDARRYTTFYVFDINDNRALGANLDGRGFKFIPGLCNSCHGGRPKALVNGIYPDAGETGGGFIPWDLDTYLFQDSTATVSRSAQESQFHVFNQTVLNTDPSAAARETIEGWYGGPGLPSNSFNGGFVPTGWLPPAAPANATQLYLQVVAPFCRACHAMQGSTLQNDIDFSSYDKFISYKSITERLVFDEGTMPLALRTFDRFWENVNIPQTLATFLGSTKILEDNKVLTPGRPIANAGPFREAALGNINLNGNGSIFNSDAFSAAKNPIYSWMLISKPAGSLATLSNSSQANASFFADMPGDYIAQLVIGDNPPSPPAQVVIRVSASIRPISFTTDIAPMLAPCASCHLGFDNPRFNNPAVLFSNVINFVNLDDPVNSVILTKPSGNHHGGGILSGFETTSSEKYQRVLRWILEGASDN